MNVIPAIDLRGGRCVRLYQGDYARETVYSDDPVEVAARWIEAGASWLHVVDLDGAKQGEPVNSEVIGAIVASVDVPVQVGGGIRDMESIRQVLELGVSRAMLGTIAVQDPELVRRACAEFDSESVMVSVDARDGLVSVAGWTSDSQLPASQLVETMRDAGVETFQYTDISRDGTLTEPNYSAIIDMVKHTDGHLIAAGGISKLDHLIKLAELGASGAVVGTAIYTGNIDLAEAVEALSERGG
ncbi:MAG: 1-(5-phosphoribosyl)-5-[(5-phosphoribosylamino)methylideneamino]imidazole-4-carboxamide isomerase [SAR202 cluster bacterium]|nr:1-(5-phosphoribosyl)-5-[(5-phosphoribosylamino)methylideneamino]imidazole-4-carboxamide isomerase [SAR202 cluster bacterium]MDP6512837.1 1-(5-phosphoribosyl)-5-[(5-phosphoribosylamino)methylideneamino]imidazole-4-carboxamide isomerase [SAR202 cluster bacterium]